MKKIILLNGLILSIQFSAVAMNERLDDESFAEKMKAAIELDDLVDAEIIDSSQENSFMSVGSSFFSTEYSHQEFDEFISGEMRRKALEKMKNQDIIEKAEEFKVRSPMEDDKVEGRLCPMCLTLRQFEDELYIKRFLLNMNSDARVKLFEDMIKNKATTKPGKRCPLCCCMVK